MVTGKLTQHMKPSGIPREALPTMYDLPSEDPEEPGLPDMFHDYQPHLLHETFQPSTYASDHILTAADLNLYYDVQHHLWHKRPDWFAVLGTPRLYEEGDLRLSYVMWQELIAPYLVVELLSPGTEDEDLGKTQRHPEEPPTKWMVYEQILGVPYYVVFSRYTNEMRCFVLDNQQYREIVPVNQQLWLPEAGLGLGLWFGTYERRERWWIRFYDADGAWIPTQQEQIEHERQRTEQAQQQAMQAQQQAAQAQQQVTHERQRTEQAQQQAMQAQQQAVQAQQQAVQAQQQAVQAQQQAAQAQQQAAQERQRAERLAAQLKALGIDLEE